jgi:hypothetical protein
MFYLAWRVVWLLGPGSRCARPGHELGALIRGAPERALKDKAPECVPPSESHRRRVRERRRDGLRASRSTHPAMLGLHDVKQRSVLRSRGVAAPGLFALSFRTVVAARPERGGGRSAGRRPALQFSRAGNARRHACEAWPSRATGRPPLGAPPWRCRPSTRLRLRHCCRRRREGSTLPQAFAPGRSAGRFARGYEPRTTPPPAPPSGKASRKRPSCAGFFNSSTNAIRSQYRSRRVVEKIFVPRRSRWRLVARGVRRMRCAQRTPQIRTGPCAALLRGARSSGQPEIGPL